MCIKRVSWPTQHALVATVERATAIVRAKQGQLLEVTVKCCQRLSSRWGAACKSWFGVKWLWTEYPNILRVWMRELEIQMWNELLATDFLKIFWIQNQETSNTLNTKRFEIQARIFWCVISFFSSRSNKQWQKGEQEDLCWLLIQLQRISCWINSGCWAEAETGRDKTIKEITLPIGKATLKGSLPCTWNEESAEEAIE